MAYKKPQRRIVRIRTFQGPCVFCKGRKDPDYKDYHDLQKFVSDRAKILSAKRTGICSKHQRKLTVAIKRARHLGLLPFTGSI